MKEIKFRLRNPVDKIVGFEKWHQGSLNSFNFWISKPCWLYSTNGKHWNPKPIEHRKKDVYTGLKDKTGVEIYEGDILEVQQYDDTPASKYLISVMFENGSFRIAQPSMIFGHMKFNSCLMSMRNDGVLHNYEVIGDIHRNPELLEKK